VSRCKASVWSSNLPATPQPFRFRPCALPDLGAGALLGLPLPLSSVPTLCGLELRRTLGTVGAALEAFDVVGGVWIVLLAPSLDDPLIAATAAERARRRLGGIFDRVAVHESEVVCVVGAHGCTFRRVAGDVDNGRAAIADVRHRASA
jgi:hypothetical protein